MKSLFDDLTQGLQEAIDYESGKGNAKTRTYIIRPVNQYSNVEIRELRMKAGMTQAVFAAYLGVSKKTVEAWERGRIHPNGPVFRLLDILAAENFENMNYIIEQ